jgi:methionyl-tRNA synthetase
MYVWCDALTNYISGLDYFDDAASRERWWEGEDVTVTHVIGKDIARFHALIWPAMLHHAGIRTPDRLLIHGFLTSEGQKMSKSLGNVVVPQDVIDKYGVDALRFYLSHEIPVGNDGDFSWKRFAELYDSKLRNQLGNLLNRILVLLGKSDRSIDIPANVPESSLVAALWSSYEAHMNAFEVSEAIQDVTRLVDVMNGRMNEVQPWKMEPAQRKVALSIFAEQLRHAALMLLPIIPQSANRMLSQLGLPYPALERTFKITGTMKQWGGEDLWQLAGEPSILFVPVEIAKVA